MFPTHDYPYTNAHEMNLDWILAKVKELMGEVDTFKVVNSITWGGLHNPSKEYAAWTIVDTPEHNGYISIKPVPVGVTIDNPDYWVLVADYSALYADIQNRIVNAENNIDALQTKSNNLGFANVKDYGATGNGSDDDTEAINAALNASTNVYFPAGTYKISNTLYGKTNMHIFGNSPENTIIMRDDSLSQNWDTMQIGSPANHAQACIIEGLWFLRNLVYDDNGITNKLDSGVCHLRISYGQNFEVKNCMFWRSPVGIRVINSTVGRIHSNTIEGTIWDTQNANLQEGTCALMIGNADTPIANEYCQLIDIYNNHIGGAIYSGTRTETWNGVNVSTNINIGSRDGVLISECEGINIYSNYIGGFAYNSINLHPYHGGIDNVKINHNFMDPSGQNAIMMQIGTGANNRVSINGNIFNMQKNGVHAITMSGTDTSPAVVSCSITDNIFQNSVGSLLSLYGGRGVIIAHNQFAAYNVHNVTSTDPNWNGAVVIGTGSKYRLYGNAYGGAINTLDQDPNCKYGVFFSSATLGSATDEVDFGIASDGELVHI